MEVTWPQAGNFVAADGEVLGPSVGTMWPPIERISWPPAATGERHLMLDCFVQMRRSRSGSRSLFQSPSDHENVEAEESCTYAR
jgi:hypothetical protein